MSALRVKTIRWGILGAGSISDDFCAGLKLAPGCEVTAVASRSSARAEAFATRHGLQPSQSIETLAARPDVDVIYVATPPKHHKEHALAALTRGKPVLLEKPFAMTASEARDIVAFAREHKLFCMEAMWMRFVPAVRELVEALRSGRYGTVHSLEASMGFPNGADRAPALLDLGVYPLSFAHAVMGRPEGVLGAGDAAELSAVLRYRTGQAVVRTSLRTQLRNDAMVYTDRAVLHVDAPLYRTESFTVQELPAAPPPQRVVPTGGLRRVTQRPELRRWVQLAKKAALPWVTKPALGNGYAHEAIEVAECLRNGALESAVMPLDESLAVMETVDALRAAVI
jgi:predicted dehydrogenase